MTSKNELIQEILSLQLDQEQEQGIIDLINASPEMNQQLLNTVMTMLDMQATMDDVQAGLMDQEADMYDDAIKQLQQPTDQNLDGTSVQ